MSIFSRFHFAWFAVVLSFFVAFAACTGPKPDVGAPKIMPPTSEGAPYRVSLVVKNEASGEGQVEVNVRLHEKSRQATYFGDQKVNLKAHESVHLIVSVPAPPGEYTVEATAEYPPG